MGLFLYNKKIVFTLLFISAVFFVCTSIRGLHSIFDSRILYYQKKQIIEKIISDKSFDLIAKTKYCLVYGSNGDEYTEFICRVIDTYFPMLIADFDYTPKEKLRVIIYDSEVKIKKALNISSDKAPIGVFYAGSLHILNPRLWVKSDDELTIKDEFLKNGPIVHELTHYLLDEKAGGHYPIWFTEGIALFYEKKYLNFEWYKTLKEQSRKITYEQLSNFYSLDEKKAYRRSYDIIYFLVENFTEEKLQQLIFELSSNRSFDDAFYNVFCFYPKLL